MTSAHTTHARASQWQRYLDDLQAYAALPQPLDSSGTLVRVTGLVLEAAGVRVPVGSICEVRADGQPVVLSAREWAVLEPLLARPGLVLSRAQLEEKLYGWKDGISSNAVEVYVHGLRKKLGASLIQNVRGVGYMVPRD